MKPQLIVGAGHLCAQMFPWWINQWTKWYMKWIIYWTAEMKSSEVMIIAHRILQRLKPLSLIFSPHVDVFCDLLLNRRTTTWNKELKSNLEPRLSLLSSVVFERSRDHVATQTLWSKKTGWQRGVAMSKNRYCNNFTLLGRQGKIWCYINELRLQNDRAKANHTIDHGLLNHSKDVCLQWLFFSGKHLQALKL